MTHKNRDYRRCLEIIKSCHDETSRHLLICSLARLQGKHVMSHGGIGFYVEGGELSDDGFDYATASLELMRQLMCLDYENDHNGLLALFTPEDLDDLEDTGMIRFACDGVAPELWEFSRGNLTYDEIVEKGKKCGTP